MKYFISILFILFYSVLLKSQDVDTLGRLTQEEYQEVSVDTLYKQIAELQNQIKELKQRLSQDSTIYEQKLFLETENNNQLKEELSSLELTITSLTKVNNSYQSNIDSLKHYVNSLQERFSEMEEYAVSLEQINDTLTKLKEDYHLQLAEKNQLLNEQIYQMNEKQRLFAEKELLYKDAITNSNIDKAKLEGLINAKNIGIEAKEKEIVYLQKSINEKEFSISKKTEDIEKTLREKEKISSQVDTLRENLFRTEKELLKITEELKYEKKRADDAEAKIEAATSRKKKVRVVQGIAMKFYRTPRWEVIPRSLGEGKYSSIISNKNGGNVEFDFLVGASVMLLDLTKEKRKFTSDIGLYVGFGGSNLFKNFYVGPNLKILDFFHFTAGVNIAEYELLADGYTEGSTLPAGWVIQTTKEWKIIPFISLSLDLEFLTYIGKR